MDHNGPQAWLHLNEPDVVAEWAPDATGTGNCLRQNPLGPGYRPPLPILKESGVLESSVVSSTPGEIPNRLAYFFALGLGLVLTLLAVAISTRVLPRYASVQQRYGFQLPTETRVALRSGVLQPIPGCVVILAALTGLLARAPSRRHAVATAILLFAAIAVPLATAAALLIPELTLV